VEIATPGMKTIEDLVIALKISAWQTLKAVFYVADGKFVFVVIRGDLQVNEIKGIIHYTAGNAFGDRCRGQRTGIIAGSARRSD